VGEDWRAFFDERAVIAEFDGGLPRDQAEARAFACCIAKRLNCNPLRPSTRRSPVSYRMLRTDLQQNPIRFDYGFWSLHR
jgi:hypothetical protein